MKPNTGSARLPVRMLIWGILALVLRKALYATAVDIKGLLLRYQPLEIALTVLTVGVLVRIAAAVRKQTGSGIYQELSFAALPGALGNAAAGIGILLTMRNTLPGMGSNLELLRYYLGLAAPVCLFLSAIARALGKKPFFLLHVAVCLFFVLHIVSNYQTWSSHPQMQDYIFSLLGAMALLFFSFYTAALEADCGDLRLLRGMGLAAIYLCAAELARSACPWLYLGGILWVLLELCGMHSPEKK